VHVRYPDVTVLSYEWVGTVDVGYLQRRVQKPLLVKACQRREPLGLSISGCRRAGKVGVGCAGREKYPVSLSRHIHVYAAVAKNRRNWRTQEPCHQSKLSPDT
jgi:hypothetical protein